MKLNPARYTIRSLLLMTLLFAAGVPIVTRRLHRIAREKSIAEAVREFGNEAYFGDGSEVQLLMNSRPTMCFAGNHFLSESLPSLFWGGQRLVYAEVSGETVRAVGIESFTLLSALQVIQLSNVNLEQLGLDWLPNRVLAIDAFQCTLDSSAPLECLARFQDLVWLRIRVRQLDSRILRYIRQCKSLVHVEIIVTTRVESDEQTQVYSTLASMPQLESLVLHVPGEGSTTLMSRAEWWKGHEVPVLVD